MELTKVVLAGLAAVCDRAHEAVQLGEPQFKQAARAARVEMARVGQGDKHKDKLELEARRIDRLFDIESMYDSGEAALMAVENIPAATKATVMGLQAPALGYADKIAATPEELAFLTAAVKQWVAESMLLCEAATDSDGTV